MILDLGGADWPSAVDIVTASQAVEQAIHATTIEGFQAALQQASQYLAYAITYYTTTGDKERAAQAVAVQDQLLAIGDAAPSTGLQVAQQQLYAYQLSTVGRLWLAAEPGLSWSAILGLSTAGSLIAIGVGWGIEVLYRRWERRHGR